ncbi:MAG: hypothetical protein HY447_01065 [Candidatus Omnitrophica bacterium]|nr:hypothetical protein [Candidatus Omnitrophota bacterium]
MKKLFIVLLVFVAIVAVGIFVASQIALDRTSRSVILYLTNYASQVGIAVSQMRFNKASFRPPGTITWKGLYARAKRSAAEATVSAAEATIHVESFSEKAFRLTVKEINATLLRGPDRAEEDRLTGDFLDAQFRIDFRDPNKALTEARALAKDLTALLTRGRCSTFVRFSGQLNFLMGARRFDAGLAIDRRGEESVLILDPKDLEVVAQEFEEGLSEGVVKILSENPIQAPRLLRITKLAYDTAREAHEKDASIPEDAYRHILWGYHLTKAYDPKFAKQVTEAHEADDMDEAKADRDMDHHNAALGREYAEAGYPESGLLERTLKDPKVMQLPGQIGVPEVAAGTAEVESQKVQV